MSSSTGSKVASVALALVATWTTAHADILTVEFQPTIDIDNFRVLSQQQVTNDSTTVLQNAAFSEDFGAVSANGTLTKAINVDFEALTNQDARVGLVGTSGANLLVGTGTLAAGTTFSSNYGSTVPADDVTQEQAYASVGSGDLTYAQRLFTRDDDAKSLLLTRADVNGKTGNLLLFNATTGESTSAGTWRAKVEAVPEPGTMAALGAGALAFFRRRRRS